ncbi:hypothetical protein EJ05DRAFT_489202 [Pseudovirgaria hyperparasitica]|uniref:YAG7-like dimerisation domain-containing protein n=1 Tax=Pseudovirgaria hyperparasitica TaxID=470096 RepID=A0A6A6VXW9_9PEZI|nr:uncharacterized protein EJ05DRAFT_489202 [Pseudovirgaria hyperparasitica]KAF2754490.1 hypothetical protein EJ05DRAFT_489202 [Pseudovirgaria hyperparasitica]
MSSDVVANPPPPTESKSARKKKAKAELAAAQGSASKAPGTPTSEVPTEEAKVNGIETSGENAYTREIQKNIRNINKKLNLMQKVDTIISENPDLSLDDLVLAKKINPDQKAQALKKPGLQAQLVQLEEQLIQYKKVEQDLQSKLSAERELLQSAHKQELETLRDTINAEAAAKEQKQHKLQYLTLSKFLHTAAAKRQIEEADTEERQAFEGVLLLVYGGDAQAVEAIEKLVEGSEDIVNNIEGAPTGVTFSQVREASLAGGPAEELLQGSAQGSLVDDGTTTPATSTDPTIANASLTELQSNPSAMIGSSEAAETVQVPAASGIGSEAANAAGQEQWDQTVKSTEDPLTESFEMVPRDLAETDTGSTPAPATSTQSWADDTPTEISTPAPAAAASGDGFHEVTHQRGGRARGDGRGPFRGRGGRGGERGRGHRGDGRGRGRGFRGRPRGDGPPPPSS